MCDKSCPYFGKCEQCRNSEKIKTRISRKIFPPELAFSFPPEAHTITDIVCQHSEKNGETVFLYELDGRGPLVQIQEPKKKRRK